VTRETDTPLNRALVEEAARKSAVLWLQPPGAVRAVPAWHVWSSAAGPGAVYVVGGGAEQTLPPMPDGERVLVTVRSKDTGGRLVAFAATAERVHPGSEEWDAVVPELHAKRLNPPDGEEQPARWARESVVTRLRPTGEVPQAPGHLPTSSHAAEPPGSPATTRGALPFVLGRRARRRR
jgi:hypothetical protein